MVVVPLQCRLEIPALYRQPALLRTLFLACQAVLPALYRAAGTIEGPLMHHTAAQHR